VTAKATTATEVHVRPSDFQLEAFQAPAPVGIVENSGSTLLALQIWLLLYHDPRQTCRREQDNCFRMDRTSLHLKFQINSATPTFRRIAIPTLPEVGSIFLIKSTINLKAFNIRVFCKYKGKAQQSTRSDLRYVRTLQTFINDQIMLDKHQWYKKGCRNPLL
jgi:hypothetical protein